MSDTPSFYQIVHPNLQGGTYTFRVPPGESAFHKANTIVDAARRAYPEIAADDAITLVFLPEMTDEQYYGITATNDPLTTELCRA